MSYLLKTTLFTQIPAFLRTSATPGAGPNLCSINSCHIIVISTGNKGRQEAKRGSKGRRNQRFLKWVHQHHLGPCRRKYSDFLKKRPGPEHGHLYFHEPIRQLQRTRILNRTSFYSKCFLHFLKLRNIAWHSRNHWGKLYCIWFLSHFWMILLQYHSGSLSTEFLNMLLEKKWVSDSLNSSGSISQWLNWSPEPEKPCFESYLPPTRCITVRKWFKISKPQFHKFWQWDDNQNTDLTGPQKGLNSTLHI